MKKFQKNHNPRLSKPSISTSMYPLFIPNLENSRVHISKYEQIPKYYPKFIIFLFCTNFPKKLWIYCYVKFGNANDSKLEIAYCSIKYYYPHAPI